MARYLVDVLVSEVSQGQYARRLVPWCQPQLAASSLDGAWIGSQVVAPIKNPRGCRGSRCEKDFASFWRRLGVAVPPKRLLYEHQLMLRCSIKTIAALRKCTAQKFCAGASGSGIVAISDDQTVTVLRRAQRVMSPVQTQSERGSSPADTASPRGLQRALRASTGEGRAEALPSRSRAP